MDNKAGVTWRRGNRTNQGCSLAEFITIVIQWGIYHD
jgi:hypothetical protein